MKNSAIDAKFLNLAEDLTSAATQRTDSLTTSWEVASAGPKSLVKILDAVADVELLQAAFPVRRRWVPGRKIRNRHEYLYAALELSRVRLERLAWENMKVIVLKSIEATESRRLGIPQSARSKLSRERAKMVERVADSCRDQRDYLKEIDRRTAAAGKPVSRSTIQRALRKKVRT